MKKLFLITILVFFSIAYMNAQDGSRGERKGKSLEKIEAWEKAKLIEILNLSEENSIRFFARKNEHQQKIKEILHDKEQLIDKMETQFKDGAKVSNATYNEQMNDILSIDSRMMKERESYIRSLSDILTPEQTAKLLVFDVKLRREIKQRMMHGKGN